MEEKEYYILKSELELLKFRIESLENEIEKVRVTQYKQGADLSKKIDFEKLVKVAGGLTAIIVFITFITTFITNVQQESADRARREYEQELKIDNKYRTEGKLN